ncbi:MULTISPECIES: DUF4416 family protein [Halobacteriovorax]|uniref:DUF4416 family protein n=1 Tax=Halobacteriovorax vibrionivorans TaxID=2152716 RepID=A0ABY0IE09_9BACT|nr:MULTISPECIES: DUF4416 family protein [Halobacteriovorax]AYF44283.1 hypothetical protein BALOs_1276 [Halobacteriovorax sp. BALOs_7]RZF21190.1 DUF4416 family protein [Halobacteriovorax vibrionivorans]TGD45660.1 DUF4416 family protein [Halobacteriovorax sp. Y22]
MSDLRPATDALLFISVLYNHKKCNLEDIIATLGSGYERPIIFKHDFFPMKEYYSKEMGEELSRSFIFYPKPISREELVSIKVYCDELEKGHQQTSGRSFNLDPGLITLDQVLLSSGKPYSHRIYLKDGVYAELTYQFKANSYHQLEWTYPDYQHPEIIQQFNWFRSFLLAL